VNIFSEPCAIDVVDINNPDVKGSLLAQSVTYEERHSIFDEPILEAFDGEMVHYLTLGAPPVTVEPGRFTGMSSAATMLDVRPIQPEDAMMALGRGCTFPVDLLEALTMGVAQMPDDVQAIVDDEGDVTTVMLWADTGIYVRFDRSWWMVPPGQDPDPLDGATVVSVTDDAVAMYDEADAIGQQVSIHSMPVADDEDISMIPVRFAPPADGEAVTAAATVLSRPRTKIMPIKRREDVPRAIQAAASDPTARWYVEKRLQALGLADEFPLPWKN